MHKYDCFHSGTVSSFFAGLHKDVATYALNGNEGELLPWPRREWATESESVTGAKR